jgi:uncharacterized protein (DUF169 family)
MTCKEMAGRLTDVLGLDRVPIALAFVDGPVEGIEPVDQQVPSACAFWRLAAERCFYAPAEAHYNCPVGAATMGFQLPAEIAGRLGETVDLMVGATYLDRRELPLLPHMGGGAAGIVYGPLSAFPLTADAVLVWMTPRSAMLFAEAQGDARWNAPAASRVLGRPACASIPTAVETGTALSFGCSGMRTFTEIADTHLLGVIAGRELETMLTALEQASRANTVMLQHYEEQASLFAR